MKKLQLLAAALFATIGLSAQEKGNLELGFGVGYNYSIVSGIDYYDNNGYNGPDFSSGFNLGFSADYYFNDEWSIKAKVIYDRKGWDNDYIAIYDPLTDTDDLYLTDFNLDYITVPVMANWHFGRTNNWYLNFGPYVGFLLNAEDTVFNNDVKSQTEATDFGLAYGIGVKIPLNNYLKFFIEYEGQAGLTDVIKDTRTYSNLETNSRGAFNVGVNFLLK